MNSISAISVKRILNFHPPRPAGTLVSIWMSTLGSILVGMSLHALWLHTTLYHALPALLWRHSKTSFCYLELCVLYQGLCRGSSCQSRETSWLRPQQIHLGLLVAMTRILCFIVFDWFSPVHRDCCQFDRQLARMLTKLFFQGFDCSSRNTGKCSWERCIFAAKQHFCILLL